MPTTQYRVRGRYTARATRSIVLTLPPLPIKTVRCSKCFRAHRRFDDGRWFECTNCQALVDSEGQSF